jgi:hypothetical protein
LSTQQTQWQDAGRGGAFQKMQKMQKKCNVLQSQYLALFGKGPGWLAKNRGWLGKWGSDLV